MWLRAYSSAFPRIATAQVASGEELFHRDAIVQRMVGIEQQGKGRRRIGGYPHRGDIAHFVLIGDRADRALRSEEHTSELQSLMRISYAVFCLKKKKEKHTEKSER